MSAPSSTTRPTLLHLPQLDGLRAVACFWVLVGHALRSRLDAVLPVGYGGYGVLVFFVLSGFLITRILLVERDHEPSLAGFYVRRAARIFPPYYLMLLAVALVWPGRELLWCAAYLFNWWHVPSMALAPVAHCWSLSVEEQFYLIWPAIVWFTPRRWTPGVAVLMGVAGSLALLPLAHHAQGMGLVGGNLVFFAIHQTAPQFLPLGMGALLACYEPRLGRRSLAALAGGAWAAYWVLPHLLARLPAGPEWTRIVTLQIGGSFWGLAVFCGAMGVDWAPVRALLVDARIRYLGRISYGLYLYHLPVYQAIDPLKETLGPAATVVLGMALTLAVAACSYRWVERPLMDATRRWWAGRAGVSTRLPGALQGV